MDVSTICCVCHRRKSLKGWVRQFIKQYNTLSHGYCPECYKKVMQEFGLDPSPSRYNKKEYEIQA
ncbi:MAG: hypothetical protein KAJ60_10435 [Desulfobulbaceae bacterium]|nr:hypothetical protein [Desulfobulbaceae bacterium]MCK5341484.1 hypothetical protein [Desulfobulbaceae bacterium]MCK5403725.1 hypothetical protein [Desulfobulbaceae bacterium]